MGLLLRDESALTWYENRVEIARGQVPNSRGRWASRGPYRRRRPRSSGDEGFQDGARGPPPSRTGDERDGGSGIIFIFSSSRFGEKRKRDGDRCVRRNFKIERVGRERIAEGGLRGDGRDRFFVVYWLHDSGIGFL